MSLSFRSVVMDIADIKVPFDSLPKTEKIKECYALYRKYGTREDEKALEAMEDGN